MARFSRTLSTLVAAGVDIIKALEITGQTSGNWVVEDALADVRQKVARGRADRAAAHREPRLPADGRQMVKIGEETGELEKMLGKIADFYEDEVDASVQALTSIVEPIMMLGVGVMVGIVIISMYLPMFKMLTLISSAPSPRRRQRLQLIEQLSLLGFELLLGDQLLVGRNSASFLICSGMSDWHAPHRAAG